MMRGRAEKSARPFALHGMHYRHCVRIHIVLDLAGRERISTPRPSLRRRMHCPYCQSPLHEDTPSCPRCGLTMEKAAAFFVIAPRLMRGVSDSAGVLTPADIRTIRRGIAGFERRFPQAGFTVAFMALGKDTPGATYTYWVFNRSNPAGEMNQGCANRHIFLLVDTASRGAWVTLGYGLEPFIGERHLQQFLQRAHPFFASGRYAAGVTAMLEEIETVCREVVTQFPRVFGLQRPESRRRPGSEDRVESQPAVAW
jgi:hypothetical protein